GVRIELTCLLNALCPGTGSRGISRSAWAYRQNGRAFDSAILSWGSALVDRSPHLFADQRHIEMSDTERCQRVDDRIDHCRDRSMSTGLTDPFRAELVKTSRQRLVELGTDRRQVVGARHGVVEKGPAQQLAGFGIVDDVFEQGLADALRHAAVHLSVGDKRVDDS